MRGEPMTAPEVTREDLKRVEDRVEFVAQDADGENQLVTTSACPVKSLLTPSAL